MIQEELLAKIDLLRKEWKIETDPSKRKVLEARARALKHTSYYTNPAQKEIRWN